MQLSGGEQQRVALARACMVRPPILLADEPTGNLDSANGHMVLELMLGLNAREGVTLVLVTHDPELTRHAGRVIAMRDGRIVMFALRLAWRETRSSPARFLFVILAVAIGVASLTGVRGFSRAFRGMLLSNARTLMAADLSLRVFGRPNPAQQAALDELAARGARRTWITETVTMATSDAVREPLLITLKAVDPGLPVLRHPEARTRRAPRSTAKPSPSRTICSSASRRAWARTFAWAGSRSASPPCWSPNPTA